MVGVVYQNAGDSLIAGINQRMLSTKEMQGLIDSGNKEKILINHTNHVRFMESIMQNFDPQVFVTTILWVYKTYRKHNFPDDYWKYAYPVYEKCLYECLEPTHAEEISVFYSWLKKNHRNFLEASE
jgi:hypothetical protein